MIRAMRRLFLVVALVLAALALGAVIPRPLFEAAKGEGVATRHILLLSNPIHTDLAIPIDAGVLKNFDGLLASGIRADLPEARYLVFGWGGRAFYLETPTWSELKPGPLFSALTVDNSVMHVDVAGAIGEPQDEVRGLDLTDAEFDRLLDFIDRSFKLEAGRVMRVEHDGYGEFDGFFEANGRFNAIAGCNTWTAAALREAGFQTGWWNPLPLSLTLSLDLHE